MAENPTAGLIQEEEEETVDYDSDGNPIAPTAKKIIMPLPPIDHSEVRLLQISKSSLFTDSPRKPRPFPLHLAFILRLKENKGAIIGRCVTYQRAE